MSTQHLISALSRVVLRSVVVSGIILWQLFTWSSAAPPDTNYDESKVPDYQLPDPLIAIDGTPIETAQQWRSQRRPEILRMFEEFVYGRTPTTPKLPVRHQVIESDSLALGGLATRKQVAIFVGDAEGHRIDLLIYIPNAAPKPVPAFVGLNFYGNQTVHADPQIRINPGWMRANPQIGIEENRATEKTRGAYRERWQVEDVLKGGYALATLYCGDLDPDNYRHDFSDGIHPLFYRDGQTSPDPDEWGAIGAWAWGLSRALDYLEADRLIDGGRVAVIGHSRLGKTALWAGAQDTRFALVISNNSGCGGAALYRRCYGERIHHMLSPIGYWFCKQHAQFAHAEAKLPVDQHLLIALMAPRPVYVASATNDQWADPKGEFLAARHAGPVFELLGSTGLPANTMPEPDQPMHGGGIGYHLRRGDHDVTAFDWQQYLTFADQHFKAADKKE